MAYNFSVSPDFNPAYLSGWFIFNTWLQRNSGQPFHLDLYDDFDSQRRAIAADKFDLIYANPFDASLLVREKGFVPLAAPAHKSDEALIVLPHDSLIHAVEDLQPGARISSTADPDVEMMCLLMLEPADLTRQNIRIKQCPSYVLVAKALIRGEADVGFFLEETYDKLSSVVKSQLRVLVRSQIQVIHHVLLAGPALAHLHADMQRALLEMNATPAGQGLLDSLGFSAWRKVEQEETEFMIDLMDTLAS